jgi:predicted DNA binding protein
MQAVARVLLPSEAFDVGRAAVHAATDGVGVGIERVVPADDGLIAYLWTGATDAERVVAALTGTACVGEAATVDRVDGLALVRVDCRADADPLLDVLADADVTVLEVRSVEEGWRLSLGSEDRARLSRLYHALAERLDGTDLDGVYTVDAAHESPAGGLTPIQRRTLALALDRGYFDVPRGVNLTELSEELGVSDTAVSQRIRRGLSTVLDATLERPDD